MTTYYWVAGNSDDEAITTGSWDDPSNWGDDEMTTGPSGPPGGGDTANLTYATDITMDGATVGNVEGSSTTLSGNFTATGTVNSVIVDGGDDVEIADCEDSVLTGGSVFVDDFTGGNSIKGASVYVGNLDVGSSDDLGFDIDSGSLTAGNLVFQAQGSFEGIEMHGGSLSANSMTIGGAGGSTDGFFELNGGAAATISGQVTLNYGFLNIGIDTVDGDDFTGGGMTCGALSVLGDGIQIESGGTVTVNGQALIDGAGATISGAGSSLNVKGALVVTKTAAATLTASDHSQASAQTITIGELGDLEATDDAVVKAAKTVTLQGASMHISSGGDVIIGGGATNEGDELLIAAAGVLIGGGLVVSPVTGKIPIGQLTTPAYALTVDDNGTIEAKTSAQSSRLIIDGNVTGKGQLKIDPNASLILAGSVGKDDTVLFQSNGTGTLILDDPAQFKGQIAGIADGDQIVLSQITPKDNGMAVVSATLGYDDGLLELEIQTGNGPSYGLGTVLTTIPISSPDYDETQYFTVQTSPGGDETILQYHEPTSNKDNPINDAVNGDAVDETGAGVTVGVISHGLEGQAMEEIIKDIAPDANVVYVTGGGTATRGAVETLVNAKANIIVDDVQGGWGDSLPGAGANDMITAAFAKNDTTFVTAAGNSMQDPHDIQPFSHQTLWEEITVAAANMLATPGMGSYLPAATEQYSDHAGLGIIGKPNITGPDYGPTTYLDPSIPAPAQQLFLQEYPEDLDPFAGTSAAAPAVAAVAALMLAADPQLTNQQIDNILGDNLNTTSSAVSVRLNGADGAGLVNAKLAVAAAQALLQTLPPAGDGPSSTAEATATKGGAGPTETSAYLSLPPGGDADAGTPLTLTVNLSEAVTVTGAPTFTLNDGASAVYNAADSAPSIGRLVFTYTPGAKDHTADLEVTGFSPNGATVVDGSSDAANFSALFDASTGVTVNSPLTVTSVSSSLTGEAQAAQKVELKLQLSEKGLTVDTAGGGPTLTLDNEASATYDASLSNLANGALIFDYTIGADDNTPDLSAVSVNLPAGSTVQDASGDNADFSDVNQNTGLQIGPAYVSGFGATQTGNVDTGQTVQLTLVMSQAVTVDSATGLPSLSLSDGGTAAYQASASNLSEGVLAFDYLVGAKDQTADLAVAKVVDGASILDSHGVAVNLAALANAGTGLSINSPLTVKSIAAAPTGVVTVGQTIQLTIEMSEAVTLGDLDSQGPPTLALNDGGSATYDPTASDTATGALVFDYTVGAGQSTQNLEATGVSLNDDSVIEASGANADFSKALNVALGVHVVAAPVFTNSELPNSLSQTLKGLVDPVLSSQTIDVYDGATLAGTTTAGGSGAWSAAATLASGALHKLTAEFTRGGFTAVSNPIYLATAGGQTIDLPSGAGGAASLYNSGGDWDSTVGSGATIYLSSAKTNITGGGDAIYFEGGTGDNASLYGTNGAWDSVYATGGQIEVTQSQASVVGGQNTISATSGSSISLYSTSGKWDTVNGAGDSVYLTAAQASVVGGGDTMNATKGSSASLYNTGGTWDLFNGSGCQVILTNARAAIIGGGDTVTLDSKSTISLGGTSGNWDGVTASGDQIALSAAQAAITGKGDTIFANNGSTVSLAGTAGAFDAVYGSEEGVILSGAQASILGGYDTINATAGSTMSLYSTDGHGDVVNGSSDALYLTSAQAVLEGSADTVYFAGPSALTAQGNYIALYFAARMGIDSIGGFNATDVVHLSAADWGSFQALQTSGDLIKSGANAIIKLDANDSITLLGVQASSLTSAEFKFA